MADSILLARLAVAEAEAKVAADKVAALRRAVCSEGHPGQPTATLSFALQPDGRYLIGSTIWGAPYAHGPMVAADGLLVALAHAATELQWMLEHRRKPAHGHRFPRPTVLR